MGVVAAKRPLVGVRELRQNLSVYLNRVKEGETLQVSEFGRVVALLSPLPAERLSPLDRMVREGRAIPPKGSIRERKPPQAAQPGQPPIEVLLSEEREDREL